MNTHIIKAIVLRIQNERLAGLALVGIVRDIAEFPRGQHLRPLSPGRQVLVTAGWEPHATPNGVNTLAEFQLWYYNWITVGISSYNWKTFSYHRNFGT